METVEELKKKLADSEAKAEENIKALQTKLSEKDLAVKKAQEDIEELKRSGSQNSETDKKIEALGRTIESLNTQVATINIEKQKGDLAKKYPDILPDLLVGKSPEEAEIIVSKQREITAKSYDEKPSAHAPVFKDRNAVEEAIENVQKDPKLSIVDKMTKVRELKGKINEI
jgi:hypothetical protein